MRTRWLALLALLALPASAAASPYRTVMDADINDSVAADIAGNRIVVASAGDAGVFVRTARAGRWTAVRQLTGNAASDVDARIGVRGGAAVLWSEQDGAIPSIGDAPPCCDFLRAATRLAGHRFGPAQTVSERGEEAKLPYQGVLSPFFGPIRTFTEGSRFAVSWTGGDGPLATVANRSGRLAPPVRVAAAGGPLATWAGTSAAEALWSTGWGTMYEARARTIRRGRVGAVRTVLRVPVTGFSGSAAVTADSGRQVLVVIDEGGLRLTTRRPFAAFGRARNVTSDVTYAEEPAVAVGDDGHGVVAWVGEREGNGFRLRARRFTASGALGPILELGVAPSADVYAAAGPGGSAAVAATGSRKPTVVTLLRRAGVSRGSVPDDRLVTLGLDASQRPIVVLRTAGGAVRVGHVATRAVTSP